MASKGESREDSTRCKWISAHDAFAQFATFGGKTQSSEYIKPLQWYISSRLVLEGGFHPDDIAPRPPFVIEEQQEKSGRARNLLSYDPTKGGIGVQVILGGLRTKNVGVFVSKVSIGPVIAISCKGVTGAFRNLTNRMEETIGECTNLHITYPALVMGYFAILRANRASADRTDRPETEQQLGKNDIAVSEDGSIAESIRRFHAALSEMTGRRGLRNEISRYEAIAMILVEPRGDQPGRLFGGFPASDSPLHMGCFFQTLYRRYDERFILGAPLLVERGMTARLEWSPDSPVFSRVGHETQSRPELDFIPRIAA